MERFEELDGETRGLLARLRAFCFPGGEEAARRVRAIRTTQRGEIRLSQGARWTPFTADETVDATQSAFRWEARIGGKIAPTLVTDAYEAGHGFLAVKLGGVVPLKKISGPEFDKGELQRYLSSIVFCPAMVLNNPFLEWTAVGPGTLRVQDRKDATGATVDLDIGEDGCPRACRADRPRMVGKETTTTPWSGLCEGYQEQEGLRIPHHLEVCWQLEDGPFSYFRGDITSFMVLR